MLSVHRSNEAGAPPNELSGEPGAVQKAEMGIMDPQIRALVDKRFEEMRAEEARASELWRHLIITEATILGLTVGLLGLSAGEPSAALRGSWVALLVSIFLGFVLAGVADERSRRGGAHLYDLTLAGAAIERRQKAGEFEKNPREAMESWMAAFRKYADDMLRAGPIPRRWIGLIRLSFYVTSFAAFVLLLIAVSSPRLKSAASTEHYGMARPEGRRGVAPVKIPAVGKAR